MTDRPRIEHGWVDAMWGDAPRPVLRVSTDEWRVIVDLETGLVLEDGHWHRDFPVRTLHATRAAAVAEIRMRLERELRTEDEYRADWERHQRGIRERLAALDSSEGT